MNITPSVKRACKLGRNKRALTLVEILEQRIAPATFTWIKPGGAAWENAANWSVSNGSDGDGIPDADDDVIIHPATAVTVTISSAQAAHSISVDGDNHLSLVSGSLTISAASTIANLDVSTGVLTAHEQLTLTGASSLSGSGTLSGLIRNDGTLVISNGDPNLNSLTLTNHGTITNQNARLDFEPNSRLVNATDGLFVIAATGGGGAFFGNAGGLGFDNAGTFRLSGTQTVNLGGTPFNNLGGHIDAAAGNFQITSGGIWQGGNLTVSANATLDLSGGTKTLSGTLTGSGAGAILFGSGTLAAGLGGALFDFPASFFQWGGSGTLTGTEGFINKGSLTISTGDPNLNTTTLINHGTIINAGARLDFEAGGKLTNANDGVFVISAAGGGGAYFGNAGGTGFENAGMFRLSGNQTVNLGGTPFNNLGGHVDVSAGTLQISSSGTWTDGALSVATGAALDLSNGTKTLTGTITGSGAGGVFFNSGVITAGSGGEMFDFQAGFFQWGGSGTLTGPDGFINKNSITLTTGDPNLNTTTLTNHGTIINSGARLDFEAGGKLTNADNGFFVISAAGGGGAYMGNFGGLGFENAGVFRLSGNQSVNLGGIPFNNPGGRIEVTAGTLQLTSSGDWQQTLMAVSSGATLNLSDGTKTWSGTFTGTGDGIIGFNSGTINAAAVGVALDFAPALFQWGGSATFSGPGVIANLGGITLTSGDPNLNTAVITNHGTIVDRGARLDFEAGGKLINAADGLFVISADGGGGAYMGNFGGPGFENRGMFRLSGNQSVNLGGVPFSNLSGRIEVTAGNLQLTSGGTWENGVLSIAAGASLDLSGPTKTLSGTLTGSGSGTVFFTSGTLVAGTGGSVLDFQPGLFQWGGSGTLMGSEGFWNKTSITILNGDPNLNTTTLINHGTIIDQRGRLDFEAGGRLVNSADALFEITPLAGGGAYMGNFGGPGFENLGLFRFSGNQSVNLGGVPFSNLSGRLEVTEGNLQLTSGGIWENGTLSVAATASLDLSGGPKTLLGTLTGNGAGTILFTSGTLVAGVGGSMLDFQSGLFQWGGSGTFMGSEGFSNKRALTIVSGDPNLNTTTLINHGTIIDQRARLDFETEGKLLNAADGLFEITALAGGGAYMGNFGGPGFENRGMFRLSGNQSVNLGGTSFNNIGVVEAAAGTLSLSNLAQLPASTLTGGTWRALPGATLNFPSNVTVNKGVVEIFGDVPQLSAIVENSGSLLIGPGHKFTTTGALSNNGTLSVAGSLNVTGNFTQTSTGILAANVGSIPGGSSTGSVNITGAAALAGTLDVILAGGFGPVTGQVYPIVNYASHTGTFSTLTGLSIGGIPFFDAVVGPVSVKLTAIHDAPDLRPENILIPPNGFVGLPGQFTFTVKNLNDVATLASAWSDAVYLSLDDVFDASDILIGRVAHQGVVAPGGTYTASLTAPLPAVVPGNYRVVVVADDLGQSPDSNRLNNAQASIGTLTTDLSHLVHGVNESGTIAAGQNLYYQFDAPSGRDVLLTASYSTAGEAKIFAKLNALPTSTSFDLSATSLTELQQKLAILGTSAEPYFLLVEGESAAGSGKSFSLSTRDLGFEIVQTAPLIAPNFGPQNVTITGSHFTAGTTVRLVDGTGALLASTSVQVQNSHTLVAQFDLTGVAPGLFDIRLGDGGAVAEADDALQIVPVQVAHSGTINASEHWFGGLVHHVTGALTVAAGVTLTIDPGAIVKIDTLADFTVDGLLVADGTLAQPVVFTSFRDDANGGDTNADGMKTAPQAGDWGRIFISGSAHFDHAEVLYGSGTTSGTWQQTGAIRTTGNASLTFTHSAIRDAFFDGILAWGGTATISDSLFVRIDRAVSAHPGSPVMVTNSTFDANRIGLLIHGGTLTVANSIVANSLESGIQYDFGTFTGSTNDDVFSTVPGSVNYRGLTNTTGTFGNISADPKFKNPATGDYRLNFLSPAIDAAAGELAPALDFNGNARYDDPRTINSGTGGFADIGAFEFVENAASKIDLVVSSVMGQPIITGGQTSHVSWTVLNTGTETIRGAWHDTLQLVSNDGTVVLDAGTVLTTATLGPGQSGSFGADLTTPFGTEGQYHWQVKTNSQGEVFEGANSGNNLGLADERSTLQIPELILGTPATGTFSNGGGLLYKIHPAPGSDVRLAIDRADSGLTEIFVGVGQAPTTTSFFSHVQAVTDPNARVEISNALDTDYYVLVVPRTIPGGSTTFALSSVLAAFQLDSLGITQGSNAGSVTIPLQGSQFGADLTAQITPSHGRPHDARSVRVESSTLAYATFDLNDFDPGAYDLSVTTHGQTDTLEHSFNVIAGAGGDQIRTNLILPDRVRAGRIFTAYLEYTNFGQTDAHSPVITLSSSTGNLLRLESADTLSSSVSFLAISPDGDAGILRPGETVRIPFQVQALDGNNSINPSISVGRGTPFDFAGLKNVLRPDLPAPEFDALFESVIHGSRATDADYIALLSDAATLYAKRNGAPSRDVGEVLSFLVEDAFIESHTKIRAHVDLGDALHPAGNIIVSATDPVKGTALSALSTADGLVRFIELPAGLVDPANLPPGTTLPIVPAGTYSITFLGVLPPGNLQPVVVTATGATSEPTWIVQPGGEISGRAELPAGIVPDTNLGTGIVVATGPNDVKFAAVVQANGVYDLKGLPDGNYTISLLNGGAFASPVPFENVAVKNGQIVELDVLVGTPGGTISGFVKGPDGVPIAGARVSTTDLGNPVGAYTDANGFYHLDHVRDGAHAVTAGFNNYIVQTLDAVPVSENATTGATNFNLSAYGSISGIVTRAGTAVAGIAIEVDDSNGVAISFDRTDAAGHYKLPSLGAGTFTFIVDGVAFAKVQESVTLAAGENQIHNVAVDKVATVGGFARQIGTNAPLRNVIIELVTPTGDVISDFTDATGAWNFGRLPVGHYTVMLPDGSNRHEFDIAGPSSAISINFDVDFGSLSGKVELADGTTANSHAKVVLMKNGQALFSAPVAPDGSYNFGLITPGSYDVAATDGALDYAIQTGIVVTGGHETAVAAFVPGTASLHLTISNLTLGQPEGVTGYATLSQLAIPEGEEKPNFTFVPPSGFVDVANLSPGQYLLTVFLPGLAEVKKIVTVNAGENTLAFAATAPSTLSGQITDGTASIAGISLTAFDPAAPQIHYEVFTDASGHYSFANLPAGNYSVLIADKRPSDSAAHFAAKTLSGITLGVGAATTQNSALAVSDITVSGQIGDGLFNLPNDGTVFAVDSTGLHVAETVIDKDGKFTFKTLAPGTYTIGALANGFVIDAKTITVAAGQTLAGVAVGAHWFVDPGSEGVLGFVNGIISATFDLVLHGAKEAVKVVLNPPSPTSELGFPPFNLLPPNCDCPEARFYYQKALIDDKQAKAKFEQLLEQYDADVIGTGLVEGGLFATKLTQFIASTYVTFFAGPLKAAKAFGNLKQLEASIFAFEKNAVDGLISPQAYQQIGAAFDKVVTGFTAIFRGSSATGTFASATNATVFAGTGDTSNFGTTVYDVFDKGKAFVTGPSLPAFLDAIGTAASFGTQLTGLVSALNTLRSLFQAVGLDKVPGPNPLDFIDLALNGVQLAVSGAQGVIEIKNELDLYANTELQYRQLVQKRNVDFQSSIRAITECIIRCREEPKPVPVKPPHEDPQPPVVVPSVKSFDPNDKLTSGFGTSHFIKAGATLPYTILFENTPTATAPAQSVTVTDQLSNKLDWSTVELGDIGFNGVTIVVPGGLTHFEKTVKVASDPNPVHVVGDFNAASGLLKWTMSSFDPITGALPEDPLAGFLPPDNAQHAGEGFVNYIAKALGTLADGGTITNKATIVFDENASIDTPVALNTIDTLAPSSAITVLPDHSVSTSFLVSWTGSDGAGSGISAYDVFVSDNGAPFTPFHLGTSETSATFSGKLGHAYRFYSQALDHVGNLEAAPDHADALISVGALVSTAKQTFIDGDGDTYTVKLNGPGTAQIIQDAGHIALLQLTGTTAKTSVSIVVKTHGGDGKVELGGVISDGALGALNAAKAFLTNAGIQLPGGLGKLVLNDVRGGADIVLGGGAANKTSLGLGVVEDGTRITASSQITALKAAKIGHGTITAAALGSLSTSAGGMEDNLAIAGNVGAISIKGGAAGGSWNSAQFGTIKVSGGALDADIFASGTLGGIAINGGGLSGELMAKSFGAVSITGGNLSGSLTSLTSSAELKKTAALKSLTVSGGNLLGDIHLLGALGPVSIKASKAGVGGDLSDSTVTASKIAALIVGKNLSRAGIFAGADLGADHALGGTGANADTFSSGSIGAVKIGGNIDAGVIAAGLSTTDAVLKNSDDMVNITSIIASLIVNGTASSDSYFAAGKFKTPPKIHGASVLLPDSRFKTA